MGAQAAKGIRKLLFALIVSLPALFNIGALLALIMFIYAIIGMALFGHVTPTGALNEMVNFQTFGRSMLLLFRLMTGAGWNDILNPLLIQPPDCDMTYHNLPYGNCGNPTLATLYLVSFIVLSSMIVINMYIAVLLENFNQAHHEEELGLGEEDLERFYAKWSRFDPYATQFIAFGELSDFVASLDPPLGISRPNMAALVNLDIGIASGDRLHCLDILHALTRRVLGDVEDTEHFRKVIRAGGIAHWSTIGSRLTLALFLASRPSFPVSSCRSKWTRSSRSNSHRAASSRSYPPPPNGSNAIPRRGSFSAPTTTSCGKCPHCFNRVLINARCRSLFARQDGNWRRR